jgi:hypothetical protein
MRYNFLRWLRKIVKVPEGAVPPKWIKVVYYCLFPLNFFYLKQSNIKYDIETDIYTIQGMRFTGAVFKHLQDESNIGTWLEITSITIEDGIKCVTIKKLTE